MGDLDVDISNLCLSLLGTSDMFFSTCGLPVSTESSSLLNPNPGVTLRGDREMGFRLNRCGRDLSSVWLIWYWHSGRTTGGLDTSVCAVGRGKDTTAVLGFDLVNG
jgi:hypothetical protein